jgi:hypothetical protein
MTHGSDIDTQLLAQSERQTKALENIQSALMFLLALVILSTLIGVAVLFGA